MKNSFQPKRFVRFLLAAVGIGCLFLLISKGQGQSVLRMLTDGLFFGGLAVLCVGMLHVARLMGAFDLLLYANRTVWKKGAPDSKKGSELEEPKEMRDESYFDYTTKKKAVTCIEPLLAGCLSVGLSLLLMVV